MVTFYETQMPAAAFVIGNRTDYETPKTRRVTEFGKVAELVDDDVVGNISWKKQHFVIEIEIPFLRAAAPSRFMIFYEDFTELESVYAIEMPDARMNKCASMLTHAHILSSVTPHPDHTNSYTLEIVPQIGVWKNRAFYAILNRRRSRRYERNASTAKMVGIQ